MRRFAAQTWKNDNHRYAIATLGGHPNARDREEQEWFRSHMGMPMVIYAMTASEHAARVEALKVVLDAAEGWAGECDSSNKASERQQHADAIRAAIATLRKEIA